jgi:hypothetical protein
VGAVTLMATTFRVKAETYASARCRVSVSCRLLRHTAGISRAIAGLGGTWHSLRSLSEILYLFNDCAALDAIFRECVKFLFRRYSIQQVIGEEHA